jgi:hypothetical protein
MTPAQRIITKFGGQSALADALGKPQSTVQYWSKTGAIPAKWHALVIKAAETKGLTVDPGDFITAAPATRAVPSVLPVARWPGELAIGDQNLPVYVLGDGRRVISRTGALNFLTAGKGGGNLESYLNIEAIAPFLPSDLTDNYIDFDIPQVVNKSVKGMTASAFIDFCRA